MKKLKKIIGSVLVSFILVFNTAAIPALNVRATSYMSLGLYEVLKSLMLSTAFNTSGLTNGIENMNSDDVLALQEFILSNTNGVKDLVALFKALDLDEALQEQLMGAETGTEFVYDDAKITKTDDGYKLSISKGIASQVAASLREWAASDANKYEGVAASSFDDIEDLSTVYSDFATNRGAYSTISGLYNSAVLDVVNELGFDEDNSFIVSCKVESLDKSSSMFTESVDIDLADVQRIFFVVPFGCSFVAGGGIRYNSGGYSQKTKYHAFESSRLLSLNSWTYSNGSDAAPEMMAGYKETLDVVLFDGYNAAAVKLLNDKDLYSLDVYSYLTGLEVYNYANAIDNNSYLLLYFDTKSRAAYLLSLTEEKTYISAGSGATYANEDEYVSMDFDATTAETLASYSNLAEYVAYAASLSEQLSSLKDAIEENTETSAIQAAEIIDNIKAQTDVLADVLSVLKYQTDQLEDMLEVLQNLSIALPEDFTITIPEEKLNIQVTVPDVSSEIINNIEVTQDYAALQDTISGAIAKPLIDAFVPSQAVVTGTVNNLNSKFGFVDDMKTNIDNVKTVIFGITPSPILKLPIAKETSKYDYGLGDYIIIDVSWYESYKNYGDKIILAFLWLMFIWRTFVKLPGIINGASGDIVSLDHSYSKAFGGNRNDSGKHS